MDASGVMRKSFAFALGVARRIPGGGGGTQLPKQPHSAYHLKQ